MNSIQMQQCQSIIRKACIAVGLLAGGAYKDNVYATDYEIRKVQQDAVLQESIESNLARERG